MGNVFIEYPKCSTCKKAKQWLENNKIKFEDRNIILETPTEKELEKWIEESGYEIKKFFNTSRIKIQRIKFKGKITNNVR